MEQLLGSVAFASGLKALIAAVMVSAVVASAWTASATFLALRAKERARWMLQVRAKKDAELRSLLDRVTSAQVGRQEIEATLAKIEATLEELPERDRKLVHDGLHQKSRGGAERFVHELSSA
jgi:hypothetical protein